MAKASDKYRNWFASDKLVSDLMDEAADDIDERDAEIKRLREALQKCDEAMTWELGGEPLDTLMIEARAMARSALQQKDTK